MKFIIHTNKTNDKTKQFKYSNVSVVSCNITFKHVIFSSNMSWICNSHPSNILIVLSMEWNKESLENFMDLISRSIFLIIGSEDPGRIVSRKRISLV